MYVQDAAVQLEGVQVCSCSLYYGLDLSGHSVQTLLKLSTMRKDDFLAKVVAVDKYLSLRVGFSYHQHHAILQSHRQPDIGQLFLNKLTVPLHHHIVLGLHS